MLSSAIGPNYALDLLVMVTWRSAGAAKQEVRVYPGAKAAWLAPMEGGVRWPGRRRYRRGPRRRTGDGVPLRSEPGSWWARWHGLTAVAKSFRGRSGGLAQVRPEPVGAFAAIREPPVRAGNPGCGRCPPRP
jgi:hypothetical protein